MKVIYAGFSKCGTKTMAQAFKDLDLKVYDALEHYEHHEYVNEQNIHFDIIKTFNIRWNF